MPCARHCADGDRSRRKRRQMKRVLCRRQNLVIHGRLLLLAPSRSKTALIGAIANTARTRGLTIFQRAARPGLLEGSLESISRPPPQALETAAHVTVAGPPHTIVGEAFPSRSCADQSRLDVLTAADWPNAIVSEWLYDWVIPSLRVSA